MIVAAAPTDLDSLRLRNEFLEMPGLSISVSQVARMLGLRSEHAAAILATGCVVGERHHETITRAWPAGGIKQIDVHEVAGSVEVTAGAANEVSLVADVRERGFKADPKKYSHVFQTVPSEDMA